MVDASVGGKTAINTPMGKNLVGAFHQVNGVHEIHAPPKMYSQLLSTKRKGVLTFSPQPTVVFMDMAFLDGFSKRDPVRAEREFRAGIAEIIKTGAIWDLSLFEVCEQKQELIQARDHTVRPLSPMDQQRLCKTPGRSAVSSSNWRGKKSLGPQTPNSSTRLCGERVRPR